MNINILDYGAGNIKSCYNAFTKVTNHNISVSTNCKNADYLILPGVGAFKTCINGLNSQEGMINNILEHVKIKQKPFLGICVGMQMLANKSYEKGESHGLGLIKGEIKKLNTNKKIPHMGWNSVDFPQNSIMSDYTKKDFYFVHSYHFDIKEKDCIVSKTNYGCDIVASIEKDNILAVQFHPEKSQKNGLELIKRFLQNEK